MDVILYVVSFNFRILKIHDRFYRLIQIFHINTMNKSLDIIFFYLFLSNFPIAKHRNIHLIVLVIFLNLNFVSSFFHIFHQKKAFKKLVYRKKALFVLEMFKLFYFRLSLFFILSVIAVLTGEADWRYCKS